MEAICTKYKTAVTALGKILVRVPRGLFGLKYAPFGAVFLFTPETALFVHLGSTTLEAVLVLNQGGAGGMLD